MARSGGIRRVKRYKKHGSAQNMHQAHAEEMVVVRAIEGEVDERKHAGMQLPDRI